MAIQGNEIKVYKALTVNDTTANGGRMSNNEVVTAVKNNVWPDMPQSERLAGSTKYRKVFIKIANDDDLALLTPKVFVERHTPGQDRVVIFPGTQTDTQNDIAPSRLYGCGALDANVSIGATTLDVNTEAAVDAIFQNGDLIRISDKSNIDASGDEEYVRLAASNAVTWTGDKATLTLATGLVYGYTAASTRVASCIETADIKASVSDWVETSGSGTYNEATYPVTIDAIGGVEDTWTITFTSATAFTCSGAATGSVGSGTTSSNFAPNNSAFTKPYFTILSAAWGGTWATNDTIVFKTHPAAYPVWQKRIAPANCASVSGDKVIIAISGESE